MKQIIFLLVLCLFQNVISEIRIIGGSSINIDKCPYQLSLQRNGKHICGAVAISKSWALTSASCVKGVPLNEVHLRAGSSVHNSGGVLHSIKKIISHTSFNNNSKDYDIALLQVSKTFDVKNVKPIELWSEGSIVTPGLVGQASGWGVRALGSTVLSEQLQAVSIPVVEPAVCKGTGVSPTAQQICAGYTTGGRDVCQGDWGGPFVANSRLLGIAASSSCGRTTQFGIYTSIPALRAWIKSNSAV